VAARSRRKRRSGCPISISLETFGDRWSLLIVRDLMVRGFRTFGEFRDAGEGISTNILADRLRALEAAGVIRSSPAREDGRSVRYRLTGKGIDLAPAMLELLIWAAGHEKTGVSRDRIAEIAADRDAFLAEARRRWREDDPTPLLPRSAFTSSRKKNRKGEEP
jgi:DNA-binding HxlR family transcriptional regulator